MAGKVRESLRFLGLAEPCIPSSLTNFSSLPTQPSTQDNVVSGTGSIVLAFEVLWGAFRLGNKGG